MQPYLKQDLQESLETLVFLPALSNPLGMNRLYNPF